MTNEQYVKRCYPEAECIEGIKAVSTSAVEALGLAPIVYTIWGGGKVGSLGQGTTPALAWDSAANELRTHPEKPTCMVGGHPKGCDGSSRGYARALLVEQLTDLCDDLVWERLAGYEMAERIVAWMAGHERLSELLEKLK